MNKDTKIIRGLCVVVSLISIGSFMGLMGACENGDMKVLTFILLTVITWSVIILSTVIFYKMCAIDDGRRCK